MLSAAALKARLDRMFLEVASPEVDDSDPDADVIAELQHDLESLYSDIPSVAEMAVEQEYLRPVRREVENSRRQAGEGLRVGGAYVSIISRVSSSIIAQANTSQISDSRCTTTLTKTKYFSYRKVEKRAR